MKLRSDYKDAFVEKHGVKLGLMSGFVKVCFLFTEVFTSLALSFVFPDTFYGLHVRLLSMRSNINQLSMQSLMGMILYTEII